MAPAARTSQAVEGGQRPLRLRRHDGPEAAPLRRVEHRLLPAGATSHLVVPSRTTSEARSAWRSPCASRSTPSNPAPESVSARTPATAVSRSRRRGYPRSKLSNIAVPMWVCVGLGPTSTSMPTRAPRFVSKLCIGSTTAHPAVNGPTLAAKVRTDKETGSMLGRRRAAQTRTAPLDGSRAPAGVPGNAGGRGSRQARASRREAPHRVRGRPGTALSPTRRRPGRPCAGGRRRPGTGSGPARTQRGTRP